MTLDEAGHSKGFAFVEFELEVGCFVSFNAHLDVTTSTERRDIGPQRQ
jgi:hypothetical protein